MGWPGLALGIWPPGPSASEERRAPQSLHVRRATNLLLPLRLTRACGQSVWAVCLMRRAPMLPTSSGTEAAGSALGFAFFWATVAVEGVGRAAVAVAGVLVLSGAGLLAAVGVAGGDVRAVDGVPRPRNATQAITPSSVRIGHHTRRIPHSSRDKFKFTSTYIAAAAM